MGLSRTLGGIYRRGTFELKKWKYDDVATTTKQIDSAQLLGAVNTNHENKTNKVHDSDLPVGQRYSKNFKLSSYFGILCILLLSCICYFRILDGADSSQCRPIYMYPSYARIDGFDTRFNTLAKKYHLYLYREQGLDTEPLADQEIQLDGIPVLFIPGNAGSFKQSRSIASECANIFFKSRDDIEHANTRNLDFFTADFNEDFTAFHGRTMLDQAEYLNDAIRYILALYQESASYKNSDMPLPQSVLIVAHSMGGIVARLMPTLENHIAGSVNSILSLSTPHAASPVTFDGDILKIYKKINDYWRTQLDDESSFFSQNMSLVSVTGGISDDVLPADYAAVHDLLPQTNGFTTFTTTVPQVWTPIDHLAIVWCKQLRTIIAKLLLEMVDLRTHSKTRPLNERIQLSKNFLLSGFESYFIEDSPIRNPKTMAMNIDTTFSSGTTELQANQTLTLKKNTLTEEHKFYKVVLPKNKNHPYSFSLITSLDSVKVLFCFTNPRTSTLSSIRCVDGNNNMRIVPNSSEETKYPADSSIGESMRHFKLLTVGGQDLESYDFIIIEKPDEGAFQTDDDFVEASLAANEEVIVDKVSPLHLFFKGRTIRLYSDNTLLTKDLQFTNLWDSLFSYRLRIKGQTGKNSAFQPFIRQWINEPFETKWHLNILHNNKVDINFHNVAPFIPVNISAPKPLHLSTTLPHDTKIEITLNINWSLTMKMLFIRYRLAIASFPTSILALIIACQFYTYYKSSKFVSFPSMLSHTLEKYGISLLFIYMSLSPLVNLECIQRLLYFFDPIKLNKPFLLENKRMLTNFYFLGIRSWLMSWIGPLFATMAVGALYAICKIIDLLTILARNFVSGRSVKRSTTRVFIDRYRILSCCLLAAGVVFYIPYQLAYVICVVIQLGTCLRVMLGTEDKNLLNYNVSLLLLMLFTMAIEIPTIIVFLHNVSIGWEATFNSHHNSMSILPIVMLVSSNSNFNMPHFGKSSIDWHAISALLGYMSIFSLIYGIRNLYWIHYILNIVFCWLFYGSIMNYVNAI
ncbi:hypothetical protein KAFR_0C03440 [Kazachstania africana CBS 2517]|uniref:GPI inositol-deacylase n=1 Tax=Kazachstania africana (strain ATCC 22294 / BCRC 22015 / CBS 2517 / CECT 1963 / NBRC 1671 / NRRL Y-8276) TaxID=1071382 RepID=H2ASI6_KAZAF|nr:hypothetical protein KAFR_0C03440 [Kazachstania africana CBS 2517]CCF57336.1 hypothetical protein KAFR_0C03440 [Kazachstania africana CBS 2517]